MNVAQFPQEFIPIHRVPHAQRNHRFQIVLGRPQTIDTTDTGDDNHVASADQRTRGSQTQSIDLFVDGRVFFDVDVALGDVGFRLIVIVVADKVAHGVVRKEVPKLAVKLGRQSFVVREHEGRTLQLGNHVGHRERFARTGDPQQHLIPFPFAHSAHERFDRPGLIAGGRKGVLQLKLRH